MRFSIKSLFLLLITTTTLVLHACQPSQEWYESGFLRTLPPELLEELHHFRNNGYNDALDFWASRDDIKPLPFIPISLKSGTNITNFCFNSDANKVAIVGTDDIARFYDIDYKMSRAYLMRALPHDQYIGSASFNSDSTRIITTTINDVHLLDLNTGNEIKIRVPDDKALVSYICSAWFNTMGDEILVYLNINNLCIEGRQRKSGRITILDSKTGKVKRSLDCINNRSIRVGYRHTTKEVGVVGYACDDNCAIGVSNIFIWRVNGVLDKIATMNGFIGDFTFSPYGDKIFLKNYSEIIIAFDIETKKQLPVQVSVREFYSLKNKYGSMPVKCSKQGDKIIKQDEDLSKVYICDRSVIYNYLFRKITQPQQEILKEAWGNYERIKEEISIVRQRWSWRPERAVIDVSTRAILSTAFKDLHADVQRTIQSIMDVKIDKKELQLITPQK